MPELPDRVQRALDALPQVAEVIDCDPGKADTAVFCEHYGYPAEDSANTILVAAKTGEKRFVACVLLSDSRLDVNHTVRKKLAARRVSFASADQTRELTGMEIGGVTPFALPADMAIWVDARVMSRERIVLGAGIRAAKIVVCPAALESLANVEVVAGLANRIEASAAG